MSPDPSPPSAADADRNARGFNALLVLRILTVVNDNVLRWLAIGLGKRAVAAADQSSVLNLGTAGFVLPFVLLSWLSGWLADRFPKRDVIRWCKFAEILIVGAAAVVMVRGLGTPAVESGTAAWPIGLWLLLGTLVVIGCQATLITPAVLGTIPEIVPPGRLSAANGVFAMVSLVATLAGTAVGNWLADVTPVAGAATWRDGLPAVATLVGVAVVGFAAALFLDPRPAADPGCAPPVNALARASADLRELFSSRDLAAAAAGSAFFWALGAMANLNVDQFVTEGGSSLQSQNVPFLTVLGLGIGGGSLLAGRLSTHGVNLGLVPVGASMMALASLALWLGPRPLFVEGEANGFAWWFALATLLLLGVGAGLFDVPVEAHFQERSPPERRGALLAALNLLVFAAMFLASNVYGAVRSPVGAAQVPLLSARQVFGVLAILALGAAVVAVWCAPRATLRLAVATVVHAVWRYRVVQLDSVPRQGPALLVGNHVSWLDGFLLPMSLPRPVRMVVYGPNIRGRFLRMLADQWRFILFEPSPKSIGRALKVVQQGLAEGDAVGIFSEGGISRTGQLLGFKRGIGWILERAEAPIVPAFIDGMWGSVLSFAEGRFFSKWPRFPGGRRRIVSLWFDAPLPLGTPPGEARIAIQDLSAHAVRQRFTAPGLFDHRIRVWRRRHAAHAQAAVTAALSTLARGAAIDPAGGAIESGRRRRGLMVAGPEGVALDGPALLATAEAFDGCCVVRGTDRLLSSLSPGDPLFVHLGLLGGPLLGIPATVLEAGEDAAGLLGRIASDAATIWLANVGQVRAAAEAVSPRTRLEAVVMPIASAAELPAAISAAAAFAAAHGLEPVVAFAPGPLGGLVAMNTPPGRATAHERVCRGDSLGRVVTGVAVWPAARLRAALGREALDEARRAFGPRCPAPLADERSLAVAATAPRRDGGDVEDRLPGWFLLDDPIEVDDDGFLVVNADIRGDGAARVVSRSRRRGARGLGADELG